MHFEFVRGCQYFLFFRLWLFVTFFEWRASVHSTRALAGRNELSRPLQSRLPLIGRHTAGNSSSCAWYGIIIQPWIEKENTDTRRCANGRHPNIDVFIPTLTCNYYYEITRDSTLFSPKDKLNPNPSRKVRGVTRSQTCNLQHETNMNEVKGQRQLMQQDNLHSQYTVYRSTEPSTLIIIPTPERFGSHSSSWR